MATYNNYDRNYRIATTEAGLQHGNMWVRRFPAPSMAIYVDHSQRVPTADYGQALRGIPTFTILWDLMPTEYAADIRAMIETVLASGGGGYLWLTVDLGQGQSAYRRGTWADVYGTPIIPDAVPSAGSRGLVIPNYRLIVNNPVIENNPATGL